MAKEINTSVRISIGSGAKGGSASGDATFIEDSGGGIGFKQIVPVTAEPINLGEVTAPKVVFIQNLDVAHFVEIDNVTTMDSDAKQKLLPGAVIVLRPSVAPTLFAKADTANVAIWIVAG